MTKEEILSELAECIGIADENRVYEIGDRLLDVINALKSDWGM